MGEQSDLVQNLHRTRPRGPLLPSCRRGFVWTAATHALKKRHRGYFVAAYFFHKRKKKLKLRLKHTSHREKKKKRGRIVRTAEPLPCHRDRREEGLADRTSQHVCALDGIASTFLLDTAQDRNGVGWVFILLLAWCTRPSCLDDQPMKATWRSFIIIPDPPQSLHVCIQEVVWSLQHSDPDPPPTSHHRRSKAKSYPALH